MSNEIQVVDTTGKTIYAIVRDPTSKPYNLSTEAFEAYNGANLANYAITCAEQDAAGYYAGTFPHTITTAATYNIVAYEQIGASPAGTDTVIATGTLEWNGTEVIDTSTGAVVLTGYALVTLTDLKRQCNIATTDSAKDNVLRDIINQDTELIENLVGYKIVQRSFIEKYTVQPGEKYIHIRNQPLVSIEKLVYGTDDCLQIQYTSASAVSARVYTTDTGLILKSVASDGSIINNTIAYVTYPTTSLIATQINTLSGWACTLIKNIQSNEINNVAGLNALNSIVILSYPGSDLPYAFDSNSGMTGIISGGQGWANSGQVRIIWPIIPQVSPGLFGMGFVNVLAKYMAGASTVGRDIKSIALKIYQLHWQLIAQNKDKNNIDIYKELENIINSQINIIRKIPCG